MSTQSYQTNADIGLFAVLSTEALQEQGYEIIRRLPSDENSKVVRAKMPRSLTRFDLDEDSNIVSYQLVPNRF